MVGKLIAFVLTIGLLCSPQVFGSDFTIGQPRTGPYGGLAASILKEAYLDIGIEVEFIHLPGQRSLVSANDGFVDADMFRIDNMDKKYTNLIKIPESYITAEQTAFTRDTKFKVDGWKSLQPYVIGYSRGYKAAEFNTQGMSTVVSTKHQHVLQMLEAGHIQVGINELFSGLGIIKALELKGIQPLSPALEVSLLYHYVHKKHKDLVPKLSASFKKMKQDGRLKKLHDKLLSEFNYNQ